MPKNLYIFRHGETDFNVANRAHGIIDIPLNKNGIAQAHALAEQLSKVHLDVIYTSKLSRAKQTAQIVAEKQTAYDKPTKLSDLSSVFKIKITESFNIKLRTDFVNPRTVIYDLIMQYCPLFILIFRPSYIQLFLEILGVIDTRFSNASDV